MDQMLRRRLVHASLLLLGVLALGGISLLFPGAPVQNDLTHADFPDDYTLLVAQSVFRCAPEPPYP